MKKHLQLTIYSLLISMLFIPEAYSQINFSEDFESFLPYDYPGSGTDFWASDESSCGGSISLATNLYYDPFWGDGLDVAETVTPSIGTSNGGVITLGYDYKLLTYDDLAPVENSDDWGFFQILYATSESGPFTLLETVDTSNHTVSGDCATRTVNFSASVGAEVYLKLYAEIDNYDNDFYIFIDNIEVTQAEPVGCAGIPAASAAQSSLVTVCNSETLTLSLSPGYTDDGLSIQWQTSTNGVDYTDVETGGNGPNYTTTQLENTWYQAIITCIASSESVTSTPVMVTSTGLPCYCDIEFDSNVEPITYVGFAGIDNTTSATVDGTPGVENFTSLTPAEVIAGQTYTITLEGNTNGSYETPFTVYIDFNQNGVLDDEGEVFLAGSVDSSSGEDGEQAITEIEIPVTAMEGVTYMRVLKLFDEYSTDPCSSEDGVGYGQAEDYLINILPTVQLDYVNLQYPSIMDLEAGNTGTVYAQAYEPGVTEGPGAGTGVVAWIGVNDEDTDPSTWTTWILAEYNTSVTGNNDEFMADIGDGLVVGTYYYASRFQLESGPYTYGGYTATGGGYWDGVTNVSGVLTITCDTEAPIADAEQTFCIDASVQDLVAGSGEGDVILWYADETGGEPLESATLLVDEATYYASLTPDEGCESETRTAVTVSIVMIESATVEVIQPTCATPSGTIEVTAPLGVEYVYSIDGVEYQSSPIFEGVLSGTHEVYASTEGCVSVAVSTVINAAPATPATPTISDIIQPTCISPTGAMTITPLMEEGITYSINGVDFQVSSIFEDVQSGEYTPMIQNNEGCISESITVVIDAVPVVPAPTGDSTQQFEYDSDMLVYPIVGQIVVEGIDDAMYTWYASEADAIAGENAISLNTEMTESATYYVTQTVDGCESEPFAVTVDIVLGREDFATGTFTYHPNPVNDILNLSYTNVIDSVEVFNLIGQKVMVKQGNQNEITVNISELSAGTYLVKVTSDGASKTIKVVKK